MNPPLTVVGPDGVRLSYRVLGEGRPVLLLHGFFSSGTANWIAGGHAAALAERGRRVIVPDLRGHGRSERPREASAYPADVLVQDALTVLRDQGLDGVDVDVAGYSLGARTTARMLLLGAPVGRAVIAGQGLTALGHVAGRGPGSFFRRILEGDEPLPDPAQAWLAQQWRRRPEDERTALGRLLDTSVASPAEALGGITTPVLVVMGDRDAPEDGRALADTLLNGSYAQVPGDHVVAAAAPELTAAIVDFLTAPA